MSELFALYRYTHEDGSAKDWAWGQQPDGTVEVRYGKAGRLRSGAVYPASDYLMIAERARSKERKGYQYVGQRLIVKGCPVLPEKLPQAPAPSAPATKSTTPSIDLRQVDTDGEDFFF